MSMNNISIIRRLRQGKQILPGYHDGLEAFLDQVYQRSALAVTLPNYSTSDLPDAAEYEKSTVFDDTLGVPLYSDGTNWRKFNDNTVVA